jgi:hypothetical protein
MKPSVSIRKPCTEDWNKMTTAEQGRNCAVCCKTVVDFTGKTDGQIVDYLKANSAQRVCGRFKNGQVNVPVTAQRQPISRYRLFMAAALFVFGAFLFTSCGGTREHEIMGDIAYTPDTVQTAVHKRPDSLISGTKKEECVIPVPPEDPEIHWMGDISYEPVDTTNSY